VTTTSARRNQLIASLRTKEDRDIFFEEEIDTGLPYQIRALRRDRGWTQKELAERLGMTQEGVSRLENPNYGKFTLSTLKRLASAFDVALVVRFEPFSHLVDWVANLSPDDMAVPDFEHDPGLMPNEPYVATTLTAYAEPAKKNHIGSGPPPLTFVPPPGTITPNVNTTDFEVTEERQLALAGD
jgi:transcriptional regulator with XRE-family HTH domain